MSVTRRTATSTDARCALCPGVMILWADRDKHTTHLLKVDGGTPAPAPTGPQPALLAYTAVPGPEWARPGALVVAGRSNYNHDAFKRVHAAGGTVLVYVDALIDNPEGKYHQALHSGLASWTSSKVNDWGRLADFRPGSQVHKRLEGVLEQIVADNPHIDGFFADDLGSRSWFPKLDWATFPAAQYKAGAVELAQTFRRVADRHGLKVVGNGTWTAGNGGGYPNNDQTGCALLDGVMFENHPGDAAYVRAQATAPQWAGDRAPIIFATTRTEAQRKVWQAAGIATHIAQQATYDVAPPPWT